MTSNAPPWGGTRYSASERCGAPPAPGCADAAPQLVTMQSMRKPEAPRSGEERMSESDIKGQAPGLRQIAVTLTSMGTASLFRKVHAQPFGAWAGLFFSPDSLNTRPWGRPLGSAPVQLPPSTCDWTGHEAAAGAVIPAWIVVVLLAITNLPVNGGSPIGQSHVAASRCDPFSPHEN